MPLNACATCRTSSGPVSATATSGPRPMASAARARRRNGRIRLRSSRDATATTPTAISVVESRVECTGPGGTLPASVEVKLRNVPSASRTEPLSIACAPIAPGKPYWTATPPRPGARSRRRRRKFGSVALAGASVAA